MMVWLAVIASFGLGWIACDRFRWPARIRDAYEQGRRDQKDIVRLALEQSRAQAQGDGAE